MINQTNSQKLVKLLRHNQKEGNLALENKG